MIAIYSSRNTPGFICEGGTGVSIAQASSSVVYSLDQNMTLLNNTYPTHKSVTICIGHILDSLHDDPQIRALQEGAMIPRSPHSRHQLTGYGRPWQSNIFTHFVTNGESN